MKKSRWQVQLIEIEKGKTPRILVLRGKQYWLEVFAPCTWSAEGGWTLPVEVSRLLHVLRGMDYD